MGAEEPVLDATSKAPVDKEVTLTRVRFRHYVPYDKILRICTLRLRSDEVLLSGID
jgi:hypothetical protein